MSPLVHELGTFWGITHQEHVNGGALVIRAYMSRRVSLTKRFFFFGCTSKKIMAGRVEGRLVEERERHKERSVADKDDKMKQ